MDGAISPALKWTIAGLTTAFVAVAVWLGVVVYRNAKQPVTSQPSGLAAPQSASATLPRPVTTTLQEPVDQSVSSSESAPTAQPAVQAVAPSKPQPALSKSAAAQPVRSTSQPAAAASSAPTASAPASGQASGSTAASSTATTGQTHSAAGTLTASATTTSMNGESWLTVTASEPVRLGIGGTPTGELASTHRRLVSNGTHTVIARTTDGREQRFTVSGSSTSVSSR